MKIFKRLLTVFLCIIFFISSFTTVSAADNPTITVSSVEAAPGESVRVNIEISDNPGIMAMAFCITYDNDKLIYKSYARGYLSNYNVYPHADKGHVSFVNVENKDVATNGKIITLLFEVKNDAKPGNCVITLANSNREKYDTKLHNSFSNSKQEFVLPKVVSGGITIQETCKNAGHKYGEWNIIREANCTQAGLKKHFCLRCDTAEEVAIPITHDFESDWTIDRAATPEEYGIMSRHCTQCDEVTDKIVFKYEEVGSDDTSSDISSGNDSSVAISSSESNNQKPVIENVVGEKVPLQEVEKLDDYQQTTNSSPDSSDTKSENTSDNSNTSEIESDSSNTTVGATQNNNSDTATKEPSFFTTTPGIIMIVICSVLSIGIIALGVLLIVRNRKA